jgi:hypothetical protein
MPGGDGTGPMGMGPMRRRARGFIAGEIMPGFVDPTAGTGFGRGQGCGRGFGGGGRRGRRNMFGATGLPGWARSGSGVVPPMPGAQTTSSLEAEREVLTRQAEFLQAQLENLRKRVDELSTEGKGA